MNSITRVDGAEEYGAAEDARQVQQNMDKQDLDTAIIDARQVRQNMDSADGAAVVGPDEIGLLLGNDQVGSPVVGELVAGVCVIGSKMFVAYVNLRR